MFDGPYICVGKFSLTIFAKILERILDVFIVNNLLLWNDKNAQKILQLDSNHDDDRFFKILTKSENKETLVTERPEVTIKL